MSVSWAGLCTVIHKETKTINCLAQKRSAVGKRVQGNCNYLQLTNCPDLILTTLYVMKAKIINIFWLVTSNTTVQKTLIDFSMKNINPEFQRVFFNKMNDYWSCLKSMIRQPVCRFLYSGQEGISVRLTRLHHHLWFQVWIWSFRPIFHLRKKKSWGDLFPWMSPVLAVVFLLGQKFSFKN